MVFDGVFQILLRIGCKCVEEPKIIICTYFDGERGHLVGGVADNYLDERCGRALRLQHKERG